MAKLMRVGAALGLQTKKNLHTVGFINGPWKSAPMHINKDTMGSQVDINTKHAVAATVVGGGIVHHQNKTRAENKHPMVRGY